LPASFFYSGKFLRGLPIIEQDCRAMNPLENPFDASAQVFPYARRRNQEQRTLFRETPNRPG
jgi:hypothetical protein